MYKGTGGGADAGLRASVTRPRVVRLLCNSIIRFERSWSNVDARRKHYQKHHQLKTES